MGVVYRATQLRLTRMVALKLVTPALARDASFRERFRREWMIAASIDHPNVIPVYEAGEEDGVLYIAMRWVEGTNLREIDRSRPARACPCRPPRLPGRERPRRRPRARPDPSRREARQHPDHRTGPRLPDRLRAHEARQLDQRADEDGPVGGHGGLHGAGADRRSGREPQTDVYSLGCVLFEALTGQPPYKRENELATLWAHVYTPPPSLLEVAPDLPPQFEGVVQRAMAKDPAERYASAGELGRAALRGARGGGCQLRRDPAPAPPIQRSGPRRAGAPDRPWRPASAAAVRARRRAAVLIAAARGGRVAPRIGRARQQDSAADRGRRLPCGPPPTWRRLPPMPTAAPEHGEHGARRDDLGGGRTRSRLEGLAEGRGLRPGDQRLEVRSRPAGPRCTTRWPSPTRTSSS